MKRLPKSCSQVSTTAGYLFLAIGLVLLAGCATGGKAKNLDADSRADFEQTIAMIREADYENTVELMAESQHSVMGAAPEASAAQGGNEEAASVSPSAQSEVPLTEAVPLKTETAKQPAVVPVGEDGEKK